MYSKPILTKDFDPEIPGFAGVFDNNKAYLMEDVEEYAIDNKLIAKIYGDDCERISIKNEDGSINIEFKFHGFLGGKPFYRLSYNKSDKKYLSIESQTEKVAKNKASTTTYVKNSLHSNFDILKQAQRDGLTVDLIGRFNDIVQVTNEDNTVNLIFIYAKHNGVEALYSFTGYNDQ